MAVTSGSAHCGGKCDGCAKISPMKVANALIVACRIAEFNFRSICASNATLTAAPTMPHIDASRACSKLRAFAKSPRAITRKQASQAPENFSIAGRASPQAGSRSCKTLRKLRLGIAHPDSFWPLRFATFRFYIQRNSNHARSSRGEKHPRLKAGRHDDSPLCIQPEFRDTSTSCDAEDVGSINERAHVRYGLGAGMCRTTSMFTFSGKRLSAIQPARWLPGSDRGK